VTLTCDGSACGWLAGDGWAWSKSARTGDARKITAVASTGGILVSLTGSICHKDPVLFKTWSHMRI